MIRDEYVVYGKSEAGLKMADGSRLETVFAVFGSDFDARCGIEVAKKIGWYDLRIKKYAGLEKPNFSNVLNV